jgi:hypothetical protein
MSMPMKMRTRSRSTTETQGRQRGEVELASSEQVKVEYASERVLLESIGKDLKGLFEGARVTILDALNDFQQAVANMNVEPPKGLAAAIATKVARQATEDLVEKSIEKVSEHLAPLGCVIQAVEIVVDSVEEESRASELEKKNAVANRIVGSVRRSAEQIQVRGEAAIDTLLKEQPIEVLALNGSPILSTPLLDKKQVRDNLVVAYEKALRSAGIESLERQIQRHDYARFDQKFQEQEPKAAEKEKP